MRIFIGLIVVLCMAAALNPILTGPTRFDPAALLTLDEKYDVRIIRDEFGVPHIYGKRDADTAFGLAYAHAEDDFSTIQELLLATRGSLAAVRGKDAAKTDFLIQFMQVWPSVDANYEHQLSPKARAVAQAYADGINLYAARHPEAVEDFLLPVHGKDVVAGFTFKLPLFYGFDAVLGELFEGSPREMSPDPAAESNAGQRLQLSLRGAQPFQFTRHTRPELGSQGVAIAPHKSSDGATRLLINSHQPLTGPVAWYEVRLHSQEGWDIAGATFPGSPVVLHGHNQHLGWSSTVNKPDLVDVYRLTMNPENDNEYLLDGEWQTLSVESAKIKVRLLGPFRWTFSEPLYFSRHGPVLKLEHGIYALRWAGMGETRTLDQYLAMNKATSMAEFESALALGTQPSINQVYADREGNIAHYYNAMFPERIEGWDWGKDLPGDRSELIWADYLPFTAIPATRNPPSGFVFNANNTPYVSSVGAGQPEASDFSPTMGIETRMTNRAFRLRRLLGTHDTISAQGFRDIKFDVFYDEDLPAIKALRDFLSGNAATASAELEAAVELLANWDLGTQKDNRSAALAVLTLSAMDENHQAPGDAEIRMELTNAQAYLLKHFDRIDPPYGSVFRHRRGSQEWALDGGPDVLRAVYTDEDPTSGKRLNIAGDSYIMFVEWDEHGQVSSRSIHNYGSATQDTRSPHYADQAALFAAHEDKPVRLRLDDVLEHATRDYRP